MGYTTSIPEPELERGDGPPPCEGYDIEAEEAEEKPKTKSKKVEPAEKKPPVTTTASTKDAKSK